MNHIENIICLAYSWNESQFSVLRASKRGALYRKCGDVEDNFILRVSLLTADIFNRIFPYVRNSAEWQKRSVWGVKYVNLLSWAARGAPWARRPRHTPTRRIKEMLMRTNLCAFLWFRWIELVVFPFMASRRAFCLEIEVFPMWESFKSYNMAGDKSFSFKPTLFIF